MDGFGAALRPFASELAPTINNCSLHYTPIQRARRTPHKRRRIKLRNSPCFRLSCRQLPKHTSVPHNALRSWKSDPRLRRSLPIQRSGLVPWITRAHASSCYGGCARSAFVRAGFSCPGGPVRVQSPPLVWTQGRRFHHTRNYAMKILTPDPPPTPTSAVAEAPTPRYSA